MTGDTYRLPMDDCPRCKAPCDAATGITRGGAPTLNDVTICVYCGAALQWDDQMRLCALTLAELIALPKDIGHRISAVQKAVRDRLASAP